MFFLCDLFPQVQWELLYFQIEDFGTRESSAYHYRSVEIVNVLCSSCLNFLEDGISC